MEYTRGFIIKAFSQLLDEKPMNKITVKDIVERCGINRNTFYYHFRDISALLREMMEEKTDQLIENHYRPDQPMECIRPMVQYGLSHKQAVLHVYQGIPRETFLPYMDRAALRLVQNYFSAEGVPLQDKNAEILIHFYKCAIVGLLLDWLDNGLQDDIMEIVQRICILLKGTGRSALRRRMG